jgi:FtsZ-binding cell division protein ZapB
MEQDSSYLIEKKVDYLVNSKLGKLESQLAEAISKVNSLSSEVEVLKNKVNRLNVAPQTQLVNDAGEKEVKKEEPVDAPRQSSPNGRTGGYNSDDVSIEKMFYFGNK